MSETFALIRIQAKSPETADRIQLYLDGNTRPDFEEEVPASEQAVFALMEYAETPNNVKRVNELSIVAVFENAELEDVEAVVAAFDAFKPVDRYIFFADDEEFKGYFVYRSKKLRRLYTIQDDPTLDKKLSKLGWDERALDLIIERFGK